MRMHWRHGLKFESESEQSTVAFASLAEEDSVLEFIRVCFAFEILPQQQFRGQGWGRRGGGGRGIALLSSHR